MPSTYTSNLGIELPADGELDGVWGDVVNDNMNILDRGINGVLSLSLSGTSSTLTTSDGALSDGQYKLLVLAGSPSGTHTITLAPNDAQKIYFVRNTTAQSVVFTQGSGGNVTIATGDSGIIYADGAGSGAAIANLTDHFAMSSVNITGGSITGVNPIVMTGGSINGTPIGASTPSTIAGTTGTFSGDVTVADKIIHSGDTNTTIRFPSADTVTVETNGSERMRISSAGNVGIGTTTDAAALLEVSSSTDPTAVFIAFISGTTMTVTGITSGTLAVGDRVFGTGVEWNTVITAQTSGTSGSSGNYTVNNSQTVSSNPGISLSSAASGKSVLRLTNTDTTEAAGQTTGGVEFFSSDATTPGAGVKAYVAAISESASPDTALLFGTSDNTASTLAVERMRISSAGNVGIGTASPSEELHIRKDNASGLGAVLALTNVNTSGATGNQVGIGLSAFTELAISSASYRGATIVAETTASGNAHALIFSTSATSAAPAERMRINATGTVFFSGSTTEGVFDGDGVNIDATGHVSVNVTSGVPLDLNQSTNDTAARAMIRFYRREIQNGSITTSSTATAYLTSSDYRLKENVQPMTGALNLVAQLNPVTYTWKTDGSDGQGFIAHELQAVVPDCVIGEKDAVDADGKPEYQGVDTSFLVATLTAAIQEQQAIITALEARLSALEAQ